MAGVHPPKQAIGPKDSFGATGNRQHLWQFLIKWWLLTGLILLGVIDHMM
jgi:hypothetical protein